MKRDMTPGPHLFEILRTLVGTLAGNATVSIPFAGKTIDLSVASGNYNELAKALERIRVVPTAPAEFLAAATAAKAARAAAPEVPAAPAAPAAPVTSATAVPETGASNAAAGPLPRDRAGLPKVPSSLNMFLKLKKVGMDTLMEKYGLPIIGTRAEQYAALKAF
jgi:hypothetical protein